MQECFLELIAKPHLLIFSLPIRHLNLKTMENTNLEHIQLPNQVYAIDNVQDETLPDSSRNVNIEQDLPVLPLQDNATEQPLDVNVIDQELVAIHIPNAENAILLPIMMHPVPLDDEDFHVLLEYERIQRFDPLQSIHPLSQFDDDLISEYYQNQGVY